MYKIRGTDGKEYGPATAEQLRQWLAENRLNASTLVQVEGTTTWLPLSALPEFAAEAGAAPAPISAPPAASFGTVDTRGAALAKVKGPAIALMVVGILCALAALFGLLMHLLGAGVRTMRSMGDPNLDRIMQMSAGGLGLIAAFVGLIGSGLVIFASVKMQRLESFGFVMAMSIAVMLPCVTPSLCCVIGLPFGIWSLVVLNQPDVKSSFS